MFSTIVFVLVEPDDDAVPEDEDEFDPVDPLVLPDMRACSLSV